MRPLNVVNSGANSTCSGRAQPGALKLKSFVIGAFPDLLDRRAVGGPVQYTTVARFEVDVRGRYMEMVERLTL